MKRRLLNLVTLLSLLLFALVAALWLRGGGEGDQFILTTGSRFWWVMSGRSGIHIHTVAGWPRPERPRWVTRNGNDLIPTVTFMDEFLDPLHEWSRLGINGEYGHVTTWLRPDGTPATLAENLAEAPRGGPGRESARMRFAGVRLPHWMPLALLAALPLSRAALTARRTLRRRRLAARHCCPDCGYDLRATPGRCHECGTATTPS
jgi:hypothetical protein